MTFSLKAIGNKWLYKTMYLPNGSIERHKARLIVLGNKQNYGIDYVETFAPVVKLTTVRALLVVAAIDDWQVSQMDVKNAFLHGDLDENVYMKFSNGYQGPSLPISIQAAPTSPLKVCKLQKSLYGLKQAPRQWFQKLSYALHTCGFNQYNSDHTLFTKH